MKAKSLKMKLLETLDRVGAIDSGIEEKKGELEPEVEELEKKPEIGGVFKKADFCEEKGEVLEKLNERVAKLRAGAKDPRKTPSKPRKPLKTTQNCDVFLDFCRKNYLKTLKDLEKPSEFIEKPAEKQESPEKSKEPEKSLETHKILIKKPEKPKKKPIKAKETSEKSVKTLFFGDFERELAAFEPQAQSPGVPKNQDQRVPRHYLEKAEFYLKRLQDSMKEKVPKIDPFFLSELKLFLHKTRVFAEKAEKTEIIEKIPDKNEGNREIPGDYEKTVGFLGGIVRGINAKKLGFFRNQPKSELKTRCWIGVLSLLAQFHGEIEINLRKTEIFEEKVEEFLVKPSKNLNWLKELPTNLEKQQNSPRKIVF